MLSQKKKMILSAIKEKEGMTVNSIIFEIMNQENLGSSRRAVIYKILKDFVENGFVFEAEKKKPIGSGFVTIYTISEKGSQILEENQVQA